MEIETSPTEIGPHHEAAYPIRLGWIRFLYGATAFVGITAGASMLFAPDLSRKILAFPYRLPEQDPITYGALGAIWLSVGILCLCGLRAPLKFLPLFVVQVIYKSCWLAFVFVPLLLSGKFPDHGWTLAIGNLIWICMDLRAIPWRLLFAKDDVRWHRSETPSDEGEAVRARIA